MNEAERIHLKKLIDANNTVDQTAKIRQLKHSGIMRENINTLVDLMAQYGDDTDGLMNAAVGECAFLFTFYTDIFSKIRKSEIDLSVLFKLVDALEKIEQGELDQHEAAYEVGLLLRDIYLTPVIEKADKLAEQTGRKRKSAGLKWDDYAATATVATDRHNM